MTVKELIKQLKQKKQNLEVRLFCHDHNPKIYNEGVGLAYSVNEYTNDKNETFIAISA